MRRLFTPTLRISIGLILLTLSLIFVARSFGLMPNEDQAKLDARAAVAEALAVQLAVAITRNEIVTIKETLGVVVARSQDILSVAIRRADGELIVETANHGLHWLEPKDGKSTATHVRIPLLNADTIWGRIEISFRPLAIAQFGFSRSMMGFIGFIAIMGFAGYYFILRRSLRELDPGRVIPERVQAAFDTLVEGVLILDERERLLLANKAFIANIDTTSMSLVGSKAGDLPWHQLDTAVAPEDFPWRVAMREGRSVAGVLMGIRPPSRDVRRLSVNATRILDGKGVVRGVIATFFDLTVLHQKNEELNISIHALNESQALIEQQNKQLHYLASRDPLTGCLNRRSFFAEFERGFERARGEKKPLAVLMLDLDQFKSINDRFGHAVGDKVLAGFAGVLRRSFRDQDPVGRYGGEEFCCVISVPTKEGLKALGMRICDTVAATSTNWLPAGEQVTVSIGIASMKDELCLAMDLVNRADQALYAAKAAGRNRFVFWEDLPPEVGEGGSRFESELSGAATESKDRGRSGEERKGVIAA